MMISFDWTQCLLNFFQIALSVSFIDIFHNWMVFQDTVWLKQSFICHTPLTTEHYCLISWKEHCSPAFKGSFAPHIYCSPSVSKDHLRYCSHPIYPALPSLCISDCLASAVSLNLGNLWHTGGSTGAKSQRTLQEQQRHIYVRALIQRAAEAVAHVLLLVKVLLQRTLQEQ